MDDDLQELSALLDQVLELPEAEWSPWLERQAHLVPRQRARLAAMLAAEKAGACALPLLPRYAKEDLGQDDMREPLPDARIGPYRLMRQLGRGGMATVWLAERSDGRFRRRVALKLPHASLHGYRLAERFERERDILAALEHPHIARLYDAGLTDDGRPFLALEYIEGQSLTEYCRNRAAGLTERLALFAQVLGAIQYAHGRLVVHRDIKPGNIFVDGDGKVSLLDFGIARLLDGDAGTDLTEAGASPLTPQYAAPEQILGQAVGTAADIYSLGVVLYELLTCGRPYRPRHDSRAALEEAVICGDLALPSVAARKDARAAKWARRLRGDLDAIVLKAMSRTAAERYATAAAFADDIERHLAGEPVLAQTASAWYRAGKFLRRHRVGVAAAAIVVASLAAGLATALWQAEVARREARTATAVKDFLRDIFVVNTGQQTDPQRAREMTARELLDVGAEKLGRSLVDAPEARAEMLKLFSEMYSQLGLADRSAEFASQRVDQLRTLDADGGAELARALLVQVMALSGLAMDQPAQAAAIEEARAIAERLQRDDPELMALVLTIAAEYELDHDFQQARRDADRALDIGRQSTEFAALAMRAADIRCLAADYTGCAQAARDGMAAAATFNATSDLGEGSYLQLPTLHEALAVSHLGRDDLVAAEAALRTARTLAHKTFGDQDMESLRMDGRLAELLADRGRIADALAVLDPAMTAFHAGAAGSPARLRFVALLTLARAQVRVGRPGAALPLLREAEGLRQGPLVSPRLADLLRTRARALAGLGRLGEAKQALAQAREMRIGAGIRAGLALREESALAVLIDRGGL
jgi:serine/threonine-protein kinase